MTCAIHYGAVLALGALMLLHGTRITAAQANRQVFPSRLDAFLTEVGLPDEERERLLAGKPVTRLLPTDDSDEIAVFGAVWIAAPARRYVDAVKNIETLERGGSFKVTKRISAPPSLQDFATLQLPDADIEALPDCRVGSCAVKLGEQALQRFATEIDWDAPNARTAANTLMRRVALEYVTRYLQEGNRQLVVYRDGSRPRAAAEEFEAMTAGMPALTTWMPALRRALLEFPRASLPGSTSFLYWQETEFGLKPTIRISHVTIRETPEATAVASKMIYASHYFRAGLELRVLVPDASRGPGFWFVTVNRSRSDGLSGVTGMLLRPRIESEVERGSLSALTKTKQRLESRR